jgi:transposase InsO family protein
MPSRFTAATATAGSFRWNASTATSGCQTLYIEPGHPWENPFIERFIGTLKRECLDRYLFDTVAEAQHLVEQWREEYNRHRPHSSLDYLTATEYARQHQPSVISLTPTGT